MKKILFISHWLLVGGTETFMMNVLRNINRQLFHVDFLIFSDLISDYTIEAENNGSTIYRLPPRRTGIKYYKKLNAFFRDYATQYDVIHFCGGNVSSIAPLYFAYKYNIPIRIAHSHSTNSVGFLNKLLHIINRNFLDFFCTDNLACSYDAAKYFFGNKKAVVIKNGINVDIYYYNSEKRDKIRKVYSIASVTHVLGHIGRFDNNKNQSMLIDIFYKYKMQYPDSILILVGTGVLEENMKQKCEALKISDSVLFLGCRNDVPEILCAMDCFIMPSIFEGLPFVLVEAQATGLPCVISNTINEDSKLSPYVTFLDLKSSLETWGECIHKYITTYKREGGIKYINEAGFNIASSIRYLELLYNRK